jgi:hypothetical protein
MGVPKQSKQDKQNKPASQQNSSGSSPDDLINTAASDIPPDDTNINDVNSSDVGGGTGSSDDATQVVQMLVQLMQQDPALAAEISNTIKQHYEGIDQQGQPNPNGGVNMDEIGGLPQGSDFSGIPQAGGMPNMPIPPTVSQGALGGVPQGGTVPPEILDRLNSIEQTQASIALDKELADTKQEYEKMKENLPTLPELDDKELVQIALQKNGLPLKDALYLWAMQKLLSGDKNSGTAAENIVATMLNNSKAKNLPQVEGKGGSVPSGASEPPTSIREANNVAKNKLKALFSSMAGQ